MQYDFTTLIDRRKQGASKWMDVPTLENGSPCVPLSVADMEFGLAPEIAQGMKEAMDSTVWGYGEPTDELKAAVVSWMRKRHGMEIDPDWLTFTPGIIMALFLSVRAFTQKGDRVLILNPVYYPFRSSIRRNGAEVVESELLCDNGKYSIDFDDVEKKLSDPRCKMMIFCSPHNPVGRVWSAEELSRVGRLCIKHDVLLVCDEIHSDLIQPGYTHTMMGKDDEEVLKNTILCTACTKTFNLAGAQVSNIIIANPTLRKAFRDAMFDIHCDEPGLLSLEMCRIAYERGEKWLDACIQVIADNHQLLKEHVERNYPRCVVSPLQGTYLMWIDCRAYCAAPKKLEAFMKEKAKLYLDEGYLFGSAGAGFERVNIACPRWVLEQSLIRLDEAFKAARLSR